MGICVQCTQFWSNCENPNLHGTPFLEQNLVTNITGEYSDIFVTSFYYEAYSLQKDILHSKNIAVKQMCFNLHLGICVCSGNVRFGCFGNMTWILVLIDSWRTVLQVVKKSYESQDLDLIVVNCPFIYSVNKTGTELWAFDWNSTMTRMQTYHCYL